MLCSCARYQVLNRKSCGILLSIVVPVYFRVVNLLARLLLFGCRRSARIDLKRMKIATDFSDEVEFSGTVAAIAA